MLDGKMYFFTDMLTDWLITIHSMFNEAIHAMKNQGSPIAVFDDVGIILRLTRLCDKYDASVKKKLHDPT